MDIVRENSVADFSYIETKNTHFKPSPLHWHDRYEICRVYCDFDFIVDNNRISAHSGDIVAINERSVHQFIPIAELTSLCVLQFPTSILLSSGAPISLVKPHITTEEMAKTPDLAKSIDFFLEKIKDEMASDRGSLYLRSLMSSLYFLLAKHFPADPESDLLKKERREFYTILEYINEHFAERLTMQELSSRLYISASRISSLFSIFAGVSPSTYIRGIRIRNANRLLDAGYTITDAAYESGFQNIRTFNYAYRSLVGCTPTEYLGK